MGKRKTDGERFREWRTAKGWSEMDAAVAIGCNQSDVHRFEAGTRPVTQRVASGVNKITGGEIKPVYVCPKCHTTFEPGDPTKPQCTHRGGK